MVNDAVDTLIRLHVAHFFGVRKWMDVMGTDYGNFWSRDFDEYVMATFHREERKQPQKADIIRSMQKKL